MNDFSRFKQVVDTPPDFTWVNRDSSAIVYEWHPGEVYHLIYQVRHGAHTLLGVIEYSTAKGGWLISQIGRANLPAAETLIYPDWQQARDYLWEQFQTEKRAQVAAQLAA